MALLPRLVEGHARLTPRRRKTTAVNDFVMDPGPLSAETLLVRGMDGPFTAETRAIAERLQVTSLALNRWWVLTSPDFVCCACGRSKAEFARRTPDGKLFGEIHEHHDHMGDHLEHRFLQKAVERQWPDLNERAKDFARRAAGMISAYDPTLICADCNSLDAAAKKVTGADPRFSFSPADIGVFVRPKPNEKHEFDSDSARRVWEERRSLGVRTANEDHRSNRRDRAD
jgi:hypothetical protein